MIRQFLSLLCIALLLAGCKREKDPQPAGPQPNPAFAWLNAQKAGPQQFSINPAQAHTFTSAKGIRFVIPANALRHADGSVITSGMADLQLREFLSTPDLLLGRVSTVTSDQQPLMSAGCFELTATVAGQPAKLAAPVTAWVPARGPNADPDMEVFLGEATTDTLNPIVWTRDTQHWTPLRDTAGNPFYVLPINVLGWCNLDKYWGQASGRSAVTVDLPSGYSHANALVVMVWEPMGAIFLYPHAAAPQRFSTGGYTIPLGSNLKILTVGKQGAQLYYQLQPATVSQGLQLQIPGLNPVSEQDLLDVIQGL